MVFLTTQEGVASVSAGASGADVLECLTYGEGSEALAFPGDEGPYRLRIRLRVLAQTPADRLAHEEVGMSGLPYAVGEEPLGVGRLLVSELVEQRRTGDPQIVVLDPRVHVALQLRIGGHEASHYVGGECVDGVPPGDRADEMARHREESGRELPHMAAQVVDGEIVVLAFRQRPAAQGHGGAIGLCRGRCREEDRTGQ